jgi:heme-degrading monooxygenase HmoA
MVHFNLRVKVTDYAAWRPVFDQGESMRRAAGYIGVNHVCRAVDDPNRIAVVVEWDGADNAQVHE